MCGIVASYSATKPVDAETLNGMTRSLTHRGPDSQGAFIAENGVVALGHTRLSIIDLRGGHQPIWNEDKSICAVVAGEFYGFETTRTDLIAKGHRFSTASDSEILIHLYEDHSTQCLDFLNGEFSFCLWDARKQQLFVARDRFGVKPVFYAQHQGALFIASEIKTLLGIGIPARWNHGAVLSQLFLSQPFEQTLFAGIEQLPPGFMLLANRDGMQLRKYWDMDYPLLDDHAPAPDAHALFSTLHDALDEAVRQRLRCDVPVGFFLSGGIDSSAVVGLARRHLTQAPDVFTVCFDGTDMNEREAAAHTARHVGARFNAISVNNADLAAHFGDAVRAGEATALNAHVAARLIQSAALKQAGYKVALSGSGSDDILGGYPSMRQDILEYEQRDVLELQPPPGLEDVASMLGFVPSWMGKLAIDRSLFFLLLTPQMQEVFDRRNPYTAFVEDAPRVEQLSGRHPVLQSAFLWDRAFLANYELIAERLEMAHALEIRLPFLDKHVFDVARTIPVNLLVRGQVEKYALRQAVRPVVADRIYRRRKHSFTAPLCVLDRQGQLYTLLRDSLNGSFFRQQNIFDVQATIDLIDKAPSMPERARPALDCVATILLSWALLGEAYSVS
jgi:asparagine synthase (glutamine-hydrolysing)